jgi:hypothetical protein
LFLFENEDVSRTLYIHLFKDFPKLISFFFFFQEHKQTIRMSKSQSQSSKVAAAVGREKNPDDYKPKYRKDYQEAVNPILMKMMEKDESFDLNSYIWKHHDKYNDEGSRHTAWCFNKIYNYVESNVKSYKQEDYEQTMETLARAFHSARFYWAHQTSMAHILTTTYKSPEAFERIDRMYKHNKKLSKFVYDKGVLNVRNLNMITIELMKHEAIYKTETKCKHFLPVFRLGADWRDYPDKVSHLMMKAIDDIRQINVEHHHLSKDKAVADFMEYANRITMG